MRDLLSAAMERRQLEQVSVRGVEVAPDRGARSPFRPLPAVPAEVPAMPEEIATPAPRTCSREDCSNPLGGNNRSGVCSPCQQKRPLKDQPPRVRTSKAKTSPAPTVTTRADFQAVAKALGFDPESLIDGFCESWLEKLRAKVGGDL